MLPLSTPRKILRLKMPASRIGADIEYRVVWSEISAHWEIHRNGVRTSAARRKKQSAIDMAILAIQSEVRSPEAKVIVTSLKDRTLKIECKIGWLWTQSLSNQALPGIPVKQGNYREISAFSTVSAGVIATRDRISAPLDFLLTFANAMTGANPEGQYRLPVLGGKPDALIDPNKTR